MWADKKVLLSKEKLMIWERKGNNSSSSSLEKVCDMKHARGGTALSMVCWREFTSLEVYLKVNSLVGVFLQGKRRWGENDVYICTLNVATAEYTDFFPNYIFHFPIFPLLSINFSYFFLI